MKFVEENSTRRVRTEKTGNAAETIVPLSEEMELILLFLQKKFKGK